jgi:hypothetical protein
VQRIPDKGYIQLMWNKTWGIVENPYYAGEDFIKIYEEHLEITIDGPGIDDSDPLIGVDIGDTWTTIEQNENQGKNWGHWNDGVDDYSWDEHWGGTELVEKTYNVTHIFALNATVMAVCGSIEYSVIGDSATGTQSWTHDFEPFLIFDTANPASFLNMGGIMPLNGPPILLPDVADWTSHETAIENNLQAEFKEDIRGSHIESDSFQFVWGEDGNHEDQEHWSQGSVALYVDAEGIASTLIFKERSGGYGQDGADEWRWEHGSSTDLFLIEKSGDCTPAADVASMTGVTDLNNNFLGTPDTYIWERRYSEKDNPSPAEDATDGTDGGDDGGWDDNGSRRKATIWNIANPCDGSLIFLGSQSWKAADETEYQPKKWIIQGTTPETYVNMWVIGSLKPDDVWSWMNGGDFIDKSMLPLTGMEATIAEMLTFSMPIPPEVGGIAAGDITVTGNSFVGSKTFDMDVDEDGTAESVTGYIMMSWNDEGVMQDQFQGMKVDGEWVDWSRSVLVGAPEGQDIGVFFTDGMPAESVPTDVGNTGAGDAESPIGIPGYPMYLISLFALATIVAVIKKHRK